MTNILERVLADPSRAFLKKHTKTVAQIKEQGEGLSELSLEELQTRFLALKERIHLLDAKEAADPLAELQQQEGIQDIHATARLKARWNKRLDPLLPEAFAIIREVSHRTVGERHFDVQLLGGIALHQGSIAEMRTGEGKTLVATLPLALNALAGQGAHLVTVNDYLAKYAVEVYGQVYQALGLSVGVIGHEFSALFVDGEMQPVSRQQAYAADITYGTNNEFGFDYLRDNMSPSLAEQVQRGLFFAIVDEADSVLIDEARTPLIISGAAGESADLYQQFAQIVPRLKEETDYVVDEKDRAVSITREGIAKVEKVLGIENLYGEDVLMAYHLEEALKAQALFKRDKQYVVNEGEVVIVDEFTGRLMPGRRYSEGLHQAIEAKEGVSVQRESITYATISFQNLFRQYTKIAGMTGTALTESEEFHKIYGLDVVPIPTNKPTIRKDLPDSIYANEKGKFAALIKDVKTINQTGQPILIGTISVEKNEALSHALKQAGVKHEVLNAKNHEREAEIVAEAGRKGSVTLATNMAGRGTDIMLGGHKPIAGDFEKKADFTAAMEKWQQAHDEIISLGGLFVVGTERHESRRIDNQLRGRGGRQGDPGMSKFYVSADDDLMRIFGGDRVKNLLNMMGLKEDEPIEHKMLSRSLETAQKRVEGHNFDMRKRLIQYDDVLNRHREVIYSRRRKALANEADEEIETRIDTAAKAEARHLAAVHASGLPSEWNLDRLSKDVAALFALPESERLKLLEQWSGFQSDSAVESALTSLFELAVEAKREELGEEVCRAIMRSVYLRTIDALWVEHLTVMQELRTGVWMRQYAQSDPLVVYKSEGYRLFQNLLNSIDHQTLRTLLRVEKVEQSVVEQNTGEGRPTAAQGA